MCVVSGMRSTAASSSGAASDVDASRDTRAFALNVALAHVSSAIDASSADAKSTSAKPIGASPGHPLTRYVLRLSATAVGLGAPRVTNAVDIASASSSLGTEPIHSCAPFISAS